jgi:hypothetical protein
VTTIKLTTWERIVIVNNVIGAMQIGDPRTMRKASKILDAVELSESEREKIHLRLDPTGQSVWDDCEKVESQLWEISLGPDELVLLREKVAAPPVPWYAAQRKWVLGLYEKLGVE